MTDLPPPDPVQPSIEERIEQMRWLMEQWGDESRLGTKNGILAIHQGNLRDAEKVLREAAAEIHRLRGLLYDWLTFAKYMKEALTETEKPKKEENK